MTCSPKTCPGRMTNKKGEPVIVSGSRDKTVAVHFFDRSSQSWEKKWKFGENGLEDQMHKDFVRGVCMGTLDIDGEEREVVCTASLDCTALVCDAYSGEPQSQETPMPDPPLSTKSLTQIFIRAPGSNTQA